MRWPFAKKERELHIPPLADQRWSVSVGDDRGRPLVVRVNEAARGLVRHPALPIKFGFVGRANLEMEADALDRLSPVGGRGSFQSLGIRSSDSDSPRPKGKTTADKVRNMFNQRRAMVGLLILAFTLSLGAWQPLAIQTTSDNSPPPAAATEVWEPVPKRVNTGATNSAPPADAVVLFDGSSLDEWVNSADKAPAVWKVQGGTLTVVKQPPVGNIETKRRFKNYQLHIEWLIPPNISGTGQDRGNSGLFLASTGPGDAGYELQILDSFENNTYVNGQAGSVYKQFPPLVNPSRKPGEWQVYDVVWTAPTFLSDGSLRTPAYLTAFHNGVLIQNHVALAGETVFRGKPAYRKYDAAPIKHANA